MGPTGDLLGWAPYFTIDRIILILIALPGGILSLRALYKVYRYGGERIWDVIEKFFKDELGDIARKRKPVLDHIRRSTPQPRDESVFVDVHGSIDEAIALFDKGRPKDKLQAEAVLKELADQLVIKATLSASRVNLARQQAAAALLFMGSIAQSRDDHTTALNCFQKVLELSPDDPDAVKFIGLLKRSEAVSRFEELERIAIERKDAALRAEALRLKADALRELGSDGAAQTALRSASEIEEGRNDKDYTALAVTFQKWAEVTAILNRDRGIPWAAIQRFTKAEEYYRLAKDEASAKKMKAEAERHNRSADGSPIGPDVSPPV